jgi:type I restriction enzyme S subunit
MTVETLITDHIDIWSSALQTRATAGRGSNGKIDLYGIKKLRELILELAVRGKLVPQDPNDEPASELLKRIAAEKAELVKQGKIKKQKPLPEISEDEKPFELPVGWEWVRMDQVGHDWGHKTPENDFTYIDVGSINKELGTISEPGVINPKDAPSRARKIVRRNTVLYSTVRPYLLNIAVVDEDYDPEPIASTAFAIIHPWKGISSTFIYHYLRSPIFVSYVESCQTGIAYPAINDRQFFTGVIAIPPEEEQLRIVSKVNELMFLCDQLEQQSLTSLDAHQQLVETLLATLTDSQNAEEIAENWARISQHFDTLFTTEASIDALKQTILQLAVMGKLVPQDPNDEPASELLKRIEQEKAQLVKEGKIKKQKPLPEISEDEKPFELPKGWEWCRIGSVINIRAELVKPENYYDFFQVAPDIIEKGTGKVILQRTVKESGIKGPNSRFYKNQIVYSKIRPSLSKAFIAEYDGLCSADMYPLDCFINTGYLLKVILSEVFLIQVRAAENRIKMPKLNVESLSNILIPVPPAGIQSAVFSKISQMDIFCDTLKSRLQSAQQTQLNLADALTDAALN